LIDGRAPELRMKVAERKHHLGPARLKSDTGLPSISRGL
jgi:hypothetical protein